MKHLYSEYSFVLKALALLLMYWLYFTSMADAQSVTGRWKTAMVTDVTVPAGEDPAKAETLKKMLSDLTLQVGTDKSFSSFSANTLFLNIKNAQWLWDENKNTLAVVDNATPGAVNPVRLMTWQVRDLTAESAVFVFTDGQNPLITFKMSKTTGQ